MLNKKREFFEHIKNNNYDSVVRLLQNSFFNMVKGVDVNVRDKNHHGFTALHWASIEGNTKIAELLIDRGAGINARDNDGNTPLHLAKTNEMAELLIKNSGDINATSNEPFGYTPLYYASYNGYKEIAELLVDKGANVNARNDAGRTPLHIVGNQETAKLLIDKGANINAANKWGETPLHLGRLGSERIVDIAVVTLLIKRGADVNARDCDERTPLYHAIERLREDVVRLLIENGANVNIKDRFGTTPLSFVEQKIGKLESSMGGRKPETGSTADQISAAYLKMATVLSENDASATGI